MSNLSLVELQLFQQFMYLSGTGVKTMCVKCGKMQKLSCSAKTSGSNTSNLSPRKSLGSSTFLGVFVYFLFHLPFNKFIHVCLDVVSQPQLLPRLSSLLVSVDLPLVGNLEEFAQDGI
jgi:hypothetical protein